MSAFQLVYTTTGSRQTVVLQLSSPNVTINWGDASSNNVVASGLVTQNHIYSVAGTYTVQITGTLSGFGNTPGVANATANVRYLKQVQNFGSIGLTYCNLSYATGLISVPNSIPASLTNLSGMFRNLTNFNQNLDSWNVSNVTNMSSMFRNCTIFNQNLGSWNVSNVTNMQNMLDSTAMTISNFESTIVGWSQLTLQQNVNFDAFGREIANPAGYEAYSILTNQNGWIITGVSGVAFSLSYAIVSPETEIGVYYTNPNLTIDWGDGTSDVDVSNVIINRTHTYSMPGTYIVSILGTLSGFGNTPGLEIAAQGIQYLTSVNSFGAVGMTYCNFSGASALMSVPAYFPSSITNATGLFNGCSAFNDPNVLYWNVSRVTNMNSAFKNATSFDQNIGVWNVTSVTNMANMLDSAILSDASFSATLLGWSQQSVASGVTLGASGRSLTDSNKVGYLALVMQKRWQIIGITGAAFQLTYVIPSPNVTIQFVLLTPNVTVNWGDGVSEILDSSGESIVSHTYSSSGTYAINMYGTLAGFGRAPGTITFNYAQNIQYLTNVGSFGVVGLTYCNFQGAGNLLSVPSSIPSSITTAYGMFQGCSSLNDSNLVGWEMSNVTIMDYMFAGCSSLNQPIGNWNVSNVTSMQFTMGCQNFNQDLSGWDVSKVTNMREMFFSSGAFTNINIGGWNVSNVTNMQSMFGVGTFNGDISGWNVGNVTNFREMFASNALFNRPIGGWDVSKATNMYAMFSNAWKFNQDISNWNVSNVTDLGAMFYIPDGFGITSKFNQPIGKWNTLSATNMAYMFFGANEFAQDLSGWNLANCTDINNMFTRTAIENVNLQNWNLSKVRNMASLFEGCSKFNSASIINWDVSGVINMSTMFKSTPFNQNIGGWNVGNATIMDGMFQSSTFNQNIGGWNVGNVTLMNSMFENNAVFNQNIASWNVSKVIQMKKMFRNASAFNQNIGAWSITSIENAEEMFDNCGLSESNFNEILYGWSLKSVKRNVTLGTQNLYYSAPRGSQGYTTLTNTYGWTINSFLTPMRLTYSITVANAVTSLYLGVSGSVTVNWGDGGSNVVTTSSRVRHTFANPGTYSATIAGKFATSLLQFGGAYGRDVTNAMYLSHVLDYGAFNLTGLAAAYAWRRTNLVYLPPLPSTVTNIDYIFQDGSGVLADITGWNTANVTSMRSAFQENTTFNQNIGGWNVGNVTTMDEMFTGAYKFNQPIGGWNVSKVTSMISMFYYATEFNQNISGWNVGNVTDMTYMFASAFKFNQPVNNWNVGKVKSMLAMFGQAYVFNQPINNWNVSKVTTFFRMFREARNFNQTIVNWNMSSLLAGGILGMFEYTSMNQDLGALNITYVNSMQSTLSDSKMSAENWGNTLYGWSQQAVKPNVYISTDGLRYNNKSLLAYNILTSPPNNWVFAGGIIDPINLTFVTPSTNRVVEIYLGITPSNTITINWGDTTTSSITSTQGIGHTYSAAGTYTVTISASTPNAIFQFGDPTTTRKSTYLTRVNSWGSFVLTSLAGAFNSNQGTLVSVPTLPSTVTNVTGMFQYATDMSLNISSWDVSRVTNMSYMFAASTSQVSSYSPDISAWNTQSVTNMSYMFASNRTFNRNIGGWNTANVTNMSNMFYQGENVATPFNQSLANWNVAKVTNMTNMLSYTAMTADNFSDTLYSWAQQAVRPNVTLGADNLFCNSKGISGVNTLTNTTNNWTIIGIISEPAKLTFVTPSSNCTTAIYLGVNASNSVTIDWGDSSSNVISTTQGISHTYDAPGTYAVTITAPSTNAIYQFGDPSSVYISTYLTRVDSWGAFNLTSLAGAFNSIQGTLVYVPPLPPAVTDLTAMFKYAADLSLNLSSWDVSRVTNMSSMFASNITFNQNIASWNTGNVTNMDNMFDSAILFNQNLGAWNVAKVTSMVNMLSYTAMSTENVGNTLYGWSLQAVRTGVALGAAPLSFKTAAGIQGYKTLTNTRSWNITGLRGVNFQLSYTIPTAATLIEFFLTTPNVTIDWGDGSLNVVNASGGLVTTGHTYSTAGTYAINIAGSLGGFGYTTDASDSIVTNIQYLTQVVDFGIVGMTYCNFMGASNLISVPSLFSDTVTNLYGMFSGCARFNDSAILNWDVSNATKMSKMFQNAVAFNQNIGVWNVTNLTNASSMFYGAAAFNQNIGAWNVTNLTNASSMFYGAATFNQNIGAWNVTNLTNASAMFYGATAFNQNIGAWNTIGVTNASSMFQNATAFNQDISGWNVANVTNASSMFQNAATFNQNIGGWNVANVTNASSMFQNAAAFNQNIGAWNVTNVTNTSSMFYGAAAFNQNIGAWNVANLTNASSMFQNAATFNQNIGSWNVIGVTNASSMFQNATTFNQDISGWNMSNVTNMSGMFSGASAFNKNVGVWNVANVTNMSGMFKQAVAFNQYLNDWIVSNAENMSDMFNGASIFNTDLSAWDTSKVTNMARMFANATAFDQPIENWNISNVTNLSGMFSNATAFNQPLGFWDTTRVTDMSMLFSGATSFAQSVSDWITSNVTNLNGVFQYYPFNEDVSRWDTSNVTDMGRAFFMAENFDQYLGDWNMTKVTNAVDMLKGISMSPANVNNTLYGWSSQTPINQNLYIGFDGFYTSAGAPYFNKLVNIYKWTFSGMALFANVVPMQLVYSVDGSNLTITVPIATTTKTVVIDWGDGSTTIAPNTNLLTSAFEHTYSSPNSYTVKIMPPASTSVYGFGSSSVVSASKLTAISTYGGLALTSLGGAFAGASNISAMPAFPASVTDVNNMFWNTSNITINFSTFDVSKLTNMSSMFRGINYNPAVSNWNTANVTNMANMFNGASNFNRSLGLWNVTKVTNMSNMLSYTGISVNNFSDTIYKWSLQSVRSNVSLGAIGAFVTQLGYQSMVALSSSPNFWNITGVTYFPTALTQYSGYPFSFLYLNVNSPVISGHVYNLTDMSSGDIVSTFSPTGDVLGSSAFEFNNVTLYTSGVRNLAIQDASNGNAVIFQVPFTFNIVCFKEDTKILCLKYDKDEYVPIQNLRKGDLVKTLLSGYVPIDMIGKTRIYNEGVSDRIKDQLYVCKRAKYPELFEDLYITGAHSILVDKLSKRQKEKSLELFDKICVTETKYRLMACVDERAVPYETAGNFNIYHIALANDDQYSNYGVYANGLLVESCSKRFLRELSNMTILI